MSATTTVTEQARSRPVSATVPGEPEPFNAADWLIHRNATATPNRRALLGLGPELDARPYSYAELQALVRRIAAALVAAGVRPSSGCCYAWRTRPNWSRCFWPACTSARCRCR